ncbi:kinetochore complex Fta4 of Sim4 subunit, or CENP-50-domain-containing protein [Phyllosticta citriasiana]|uniref:Kinetochore complex Fta4 of Sim4 subunit, or CENP-50-domain-containing protein n=1 Tax=Phyllosticta citriasiana TaxID=595635 RepID=A0ABR1KDM4_9PEZI
MSGANTIIDLKSAFIRRQTRILSQPLQAPQQWKDDCDIPDAAVRSAMREVNRRLARHNRTAYPSIAIRHTAETIDELYWQRSAPKPSTSSSYSSASTTHLDPTASTAVDDDPFHPTADLTSAPTIAALPPTWAELVDSDTASSLLLPQTTTTKTETKTTTSTNDNPLTHQQQQQQSYTAHATNLHALSARRAALRLKISRYKALRAALAPLANPAEKVQPNLVTRDGEVAGEVARARALGVRVAARVGARREERAREGRERDGGERGRRGMVGEGDGEEDGDAVICETPEAARQRERSKLAGVLEW